MSQHSSNRMERAIAVVHGHTLDKLEELLDWAWSDLVSPLRLEAVLPGGMSNINIRGRVGDSAILLKVPSLLPPFEENPYDRLFDVSTYLADAGLVPAALRVGRLEDNEMTPFIIYEFIDGERHPSLQDFSLGDLVALKTVRHTLSELSPPGVPTFRTALDYVESLFSRVSVVIDRHSPVESEVRDAVAEFLRLGDRLREHAEGIEDWSVKAMHGDLHEGNLIFSHGRAYLLDLEECAIGDPRIDLAYLRVQPTEYHNESLLLSLLDGATYDSIRPLEPLALGFAIGWTLERLVLLVSDRVERNATSGYTKDQMLSYVNTKLREFQKGLST
ncbi:MAG: phosphotransferase family protein [Candidatus Thorarchaeota archaeon]